MKKFQIGHAKTETLALRWYSLNNGASETFEGEMSAIERELDGRAFEEREKQFGIPSDTLSLPDPWWLHR